MIDPIIAQVGEEADGVTQWAQHGGARVRMSRGDAGLSLARELVKLAFDPARPYSTARGDVVSMRYSSLGYAAGLRVDEPDSGKGMRLRPHRAFGGE